MHGEREEHQEKESEIPEEDGAIEEADDPSLDEEQPAEESEPVASDEEESQPTDEDEDEHEDESVGEAEDDDLFEEEPPQRRGCLAGCITPIIVIFTVVLVMAMIGYSKRDVIQRGLLKRIVANTQDNILRDSADMDKNQIETDFEKVKLALKEGRVNEEALTEAIEEYQDAVREKPSIEQKKQAINELMTDLSAAIMRGDR